MSKKIIYPIAFMAVALLVFAMLMVPRALASPSAATLTVNSTLDEPDSNVGDGICSSTPSGKCTLRAAVMQANVINVDTTILVPTGIYSLTIPPVGSDGPETGDLNLTAPASGNPVITITGAGASTTLIDANQNDRVFNIAASRTASISGVTIRNGSVPANSFGGGIYNSGTLTVSNSMLNLNNGGDGGGIFNAFSALTVSNSTFSQNNASLSGGGIFNDYGTMTVSSSTISQNNGAGGGGILNIGTMTMTNSTLSQNNSIGGGSGGGIDNDQFGSLIVVNSTISQNKANNNGGGIFDFNSSANVYNTSIVFNDADSDRDGNGSGGGVFNDPTYADAPFNLRNTLVAGNTEFNTIVNDDCTGTIHSYGRNLFGVVAGCTIINGSGGSWTFLNSLNLLGPLQNNGGPTLTHALLQGSNAIDGADPVFGCTDYNGNTIATDQRGLARKVGIRCDVGAYEYRPPLYLPLIRR